ncbi:unnamed protein product [Fusarium equiseti]|uniref:Enoyl reductase (ER) domain-containing protein n=1 Tax=Fusarium equiseti TaxID=61235 RepID=A0A8J2IX49_FUSEQ|nr:unnamed protein product [Fusarium equiseti]
MMNNKSVTLGQYNSACVTATYTISPKNEPDLRVFEERFRFALEGSLQATIQQHPGLLYGISDETEAGIAMYKQVDQIDQRDVLRIINSNEVNSTSADPKETTPDALLSQILGEAHAEHWLPNKPAWKIIVLKHFQIDYKNHNSDRTSLKRLDIAFVAHHAIADGLSGVAFHTSLMENFEGLSTSFCQPSWPMTFNERRTPPIAIEESVDCLSCNCAICSSPDTCGRKAWAGEAISTTPTVSLNHMVRIVTIPADELSAVLQKCKQAKVTLTALLHALICTSLRRGIKEAVPGFRSVTPLSLRQHTGASKRDIECEPGSMAEGQSTIELAQSFGSDMTMKAGQFPHGSMVTRLNRIEDLVSHFQSQGGTERKYTYELSNLGSTSDISPPNGSNLKLEKLIFTQCAVVAGPAIVFNCVSTRGGPLVISVTWQEGIIEESLVDRVVQELEDRLGIILPQTAKQTVTTKMDSEPLAEWIILIPDIEGSLESRMSVRDTHVKEMIKHVDSGLFQMGGATLNTDRIDGSAIIARAKSKAEILDVLKAGIYTRSRVWDLGNAKFIPHPPTNVTSLAMESIAIVQRGKGFAQETVTLPPLKEHQVYVKVEYAAFNPTDRLALDVNAFGDGAVLGCDFAGTVVEAHPTVTKLQTGDRLAGFVWGGEIKGLGAYSTYTIADERLSFKVPNNTSPAQAASVSLAANTAWLALFSDDSIAYNSDRSTEKAALLIWGGNTTVGYFAIQLARLYNIEVATTCSPRNFEKVRQAGATHVFDYNDEDVIAKIRHALPNLKRVFDTVGNETSSATAARAISGKEGLLCTVRPGKANTQDVPSHVKVTEVFVFTAFPTEHNYRGKAHWPVKIGDHNLSAEFHGQLEALLSDGSLKPPPIRTIGQLSPSTVEEAMELNRQGRISGEKLVFNGLP